MKCPSCLSRLSRTESGQVVFICDQCGTRSVSLEELRATLSPLVFRQIQNKNHILKKSSKFDCPQCTQALFSMSTKHRGEEVEIDLCSSCKLVWFDIGELQHFLLYFCMRISVTWWAIFIFCGFLVILQFIGLQQQIAGVTSVSYLSHLGGFAAGLLFGLAARYGWMPKKY